MVSIEIVLTGCHCIKGQWFIFKIERKLRKKNLCSVLFCYLLWFLHYLNIELKKNLYQFSAVFYKCIPDLYKWMNICLKVSWTECAIPRYICVHCKQTPLLKIGSTKGVAKWVYIKTFLCSAAWNLLSGIEIKEKIISVPIIVN